jgi:hypothetical protein
MFIKLSKTSIVSIVLGLSMLAASVASADDARALRNVAGRGLKALKTTAPRARAVGNNITNRNSPAQSLQNLNTLGNILGYSDRSHGSHHSRDNWFGSGYGYGYGNPYDSRSYRDPDRAYADAYRDVGIANAVVGLVGVIANSGTPVYQQPCGHYERTKVLVQEGHYEETRVWVSEGYDPAARVERGHYEIQRRWIPEVYEYRDVLVR